MKADVATKSPGALQLRIASLRAVTTQLGPWIASSDHQVSALAAALIELRFATRAASRARGRPGLIILARKAAEERVDAAASGRVGEEAMAIDRRPGACRARRPAPAARLADTAGGHRP